MNKYERWNKASEDYFNNLSKEKLIEDSRNVGIILVPLKIDRVKSRILQKRKVPSHIRTIRIGLSNPLAHLNKQKKLSSK